MRLAFITIFALIMTCGTELLAGHQYDEGVARGMVEQARPRTTSGSIPGRGAIQQQGQQGQGQQGQQGQSDRLTQMAQQIQAMSGGAGRAADSPTRGKADKPLEIAKEAEKFFGEANKNTSEAFKQIQQNFATNQDKLKPAQDNNKITEGLAEDQAKLQEANAKAPPVGMEGVAGIIKQQQDLSDTGVKTLAQIGVQQAPPGPIVFAPPASNGTIADKLKMFAASAAPKTRSTFSAGDQLVGGSNEAIPALPGSRIGENNIGHAFAATSRGASSVPERIDQPNLGSATSFSRGAMDNSAPEVPSSGFVGNIVRPSNSGGSASSGASVFDSVGVNEDSGSDRRPASSVSATKVSAIDSMGDDDTPELKPKRKLGRGARSQLLKRSLSK